MRLDTKFEFGDIVYWTKKNPPRPRRTKCDACSGSGVLETTSVKMPTFRCPNCYGSGTVVVDSLPQVMSYEVVGPLTIGSVQIEAFSSNVDWKEDRILYMAWETGIGTGTLYIEDLLFATVEEAHAAADERGWLRVEQLVISDADD